LVNSKLYLIFVLQIKKIVNTMFHVKRNIMNNLRFKTIKEMCLYFGHSKQWIEKRYKILYCYQNGVRSCYILKRK